MIVPKERQPVDPQPVKLRKLLLVEGDTPVHFFEAILRHLTLENEVEIRNYGGIRQLRSYLKALSKSTEFRSLVQSLGIARDAEDDPAGAKASVMSAVHAAQIPSHVNVQIEILPDDRTKGMIETLFVQSVEANPHFKCVNMFFECTSQNGISYPGELLERQTRDSSLSCHRTKGTDDARPCVIRWRVAILRCRV